MDGAGHAHEFCLAGGGAAVARERADGAERRANAGFPLTVGFENPGGSDYVRCARPRTSAGNLDPALHSHAVIANMVRGGDGKWRSMANERLYASKMVLGALYRSELAQGLARLGYGIEKTHADGRFEIAGVSRQVIDAFSSRRAEIEAGMAERGMGAPGDNPRLAERAALMSRAAKRDIDRDELRGLWQRQAADLGFDAKALAAEAVSSVPAREAARESGRETGPASGPAAGHGGMGAAPETVAGAERPRTGSVAADAVAWAVAHLSEREAVFARTDLLAAALAWNPGAVPIGDIEREVGALAKAGTLHAARLPGAEGLLTTDRAVAQEKETIALAECGQGRGAAAMRARAVDKALRNGPLTHGQKEAVTGERIAALEAVEPERAKGREAASEIGRNVGEGVGSGALSTDADMEKVQAPKSADREFGL